MSNEDPGGNQKESVLSHRLLLAATGEFDMASIQFLNLSDSGIEDISALEDCANLTRLDMRRNEISVVKPLRNLRALTSLNLSANRITNIDALEGLESLVDLNLAGNLIGTFERILCLTGIDSLEKLRFCDSVQRLSNPICHNLSYEEKIISMFPKLVTLDGMRFEGYGSELYKICKDLDEQIKTERTFGPVEQRSLPGAWLRPGYFSLPPPSNKEDYATIEFRETLEQCRKLNNVAKDHIEVMKK